MRRKLSAVALAAAFLLAGACSDGGQPGGSEDTSEPGDRAESLTIYSGREEDLVGPLIERFEESSGIEADVRYGETAELAAQLVEEGDNSPADIFWAQDAGALGSVEQAGRFEELSGDVIEKVPARFRSADDRWVGTQGRARVLVYNTDAVEEADLPASVLDLTDERWKGKIGWAPTNGSFQAFVTALRKVEGDELAGRWLEEMVANDAQVYDGNSAIVTAVANGEIDAGLVNHYYLLEMGKEDADVKENAANHFFEGGDVGSLVNTAGVGILKGAENRESADEFVEYLLSRSGAEYGDEEVYEYPLVEGLDTPKGLPELDAIEQPDVDLSDLSDLEGTLNLLREKEVI